MRLDSKGSHSKLFLFHIGRKELKAVLEQTGLILGTDGLALRGRAPVVDGARVAAWADAAHWLVEPTGYLCIFLYRYFS